MIYAAEAAILARLAERCAPGSILLGTLAAVDLTDDSSGPVIGQIVLTNISPTRQVGKDARLEIGYAFSVYCDTGRATEPEQHAAFDLLEDAGHALVGWEILPGREIQIVDGPGTGNDGRITRLSFGFTIPAFFAGN